MALDSIHRLIDRAASLPPLRPLLRRRYEARFPTLGHAFHGVYGSFDEAAAAVPPSRPGSYDNDASAGMYVGWHEVTDYDYPALFWLHEWVRSRPCERVVDLGGSTGIKFRAFEPLLGLSETSRWLVVDVEAVAKLGRRLAEDEGLSDRLAFSSEWADASGCDVLLASGSLQYLPRSLGELLDALEEPPARVVVNTTPVHAERSFFTLNSIGTAVCPYRVTARDELIEQVSAAGYVLRDSWRNPGKELRMPYAPELSLQHYAGFCFDRVAPPA